MLSSGGGFPPGAPEISEAPAGGGGDENHVVGEETSPLPSFSRRGEEGVPANEHKKGDTTGVSQLDQGGELKKLSRYADLSAGAPSVERTPAPAPGGTSAGCGSLLDLATATLLDLASERGDPPSGGPKKRKVASVAGEESTEESANFVSKEWGKRNKKHPVPPGVRQGRWTEFEHMVFIDGLDQHGRDWNFIAQQLKTRTAVQVSKKKEACVGWAR